MAAALRLLTLFNDSRFFTSARSRWPGAGSWLLLLGVLNLLSTTALAQGTPPPECSQDEKFINTWYFGNRAGLNFSQATDSIPPAVLTDGRMVAPAGSGVMSDGNGNLLFYSNGDTIWNRNHQVMTNGTGLGGNRLGTDGPLAIKRPGSPATPGEPTRYYIFTQDAQGGPKGLSYSEIVIPTGTEGEVVAATKNTLLTRGTAEKMTGVVHKNGCDIWIIVHGWGTGTSGAENRGDSFLAYRVRPGGIDPAPIVSTLGPLHAPSVAAQGYRGQMKVSPDGQRLAVARFSETLADSSGTVELYDFDAETGKVSGGRVLDSGAGRYYGVDFSPGRSYLYATVLSPPQLLQFDLTVNGDSIAASKLVIPTPAGGPNLGSIQAAPNGKLYVARENQLELGVITYPDSLGATISYAANDSVQALGGRRSGLGLPNFSQSSLLRVGFGAEITACREISFQAGSPIPNPESYAWTFATQSGTVLGRSSIEKPVFTFPAPGDYIITLRITNFCFCREIEGLIRVPGLPEPGSIAAPQIICAGAAPAPLTSTVNASGDAGLPLAYQWESSPDNVNFTAIGGATGASFLPPSSLPTGTTYFRRRAQLLLPTGQGPYCTPSFTPSVAITVLPAVTAGRIAADQIVCVGTAPAPLTSTAAPTGGTGTFTYQWESSADNATFTPISGATGETFAPGLLTATTYFRRQVRSGPCAADPANVVTIRVVPALVAGSIGANQALCAGTTPTPLTSTGEAAGGNGGIAYQWESSADNATWTAIGGATGPSFAPGALTATTYFRRRANADGACAPAFSNVVVISVTPALTAGTIGGDQTLCAGAAITTLGSLTGPSGGTGSYTYQWESSDNNANWSPISGATSASYTPEAVTRTTYYRRSVTSGPCGPVTSASVTITILPPLTAGNISPSDQDICAGATPTPLASTGEATGGTGTYAYQWQSSADNTNWADIGGATSATFAPGALTATTYFRRRVTSGTGTCATAFSSAVVVRVTPIVTTGVTLTPPPVQCPGTALTFTAVATNAGNAPTYRWLVNNVAVANGPVFISTTLVTGDQVRVEVTPTPGLCSTGPAAASVTVTRTPTPAPTLAITAQPGGPVCAGSPLTFSIASVTEAGPAPEYQWQVNGNDVAGATGPVFTSTTLRDGQTVTLRLRTTTVCGQPAAVVSNGIAVRISPPVDVDAGPDKEILAGTSVTLEGRADGTYPVTWTPAVGLSFPGNDRLHPVASPTVTTTYRLSAGEGGCADFDEVTITVRPAIRIPNAFTPNNDGRDDTWQIEFIEQFPNNTVSVFNRWGNRVFSADNYSRANEWRGDINGQPAPVGTYYYVVVTKGPLGKSYSGPITILY